MPDTRNMNYRVGQVMKMGLLSGSCDIRILKITAKRIVFERVNAPDLPLFRSSATFLQFEEATVAWNL